MSTGDGRRSAHGHHYGKLFLPKSKAPENANIFCCASRIIPQYMDSQIWTARGKAHHGLCRWCSVSPSPELWLRQNMHKAVSPFKTSIETHTVPASKPSGALGPSRKLGVNSRKIMDSQAYYLEACRLVVFSHAFWSAEQKRACC